MMGKFVNSVNILAVLLAAIIGTACSSQTSDVRSAQAAETAPADKEVATALAMIERSPDSPDAYSRLAIIYIKKARATGDFELNSKAEAAVAQALQIAPEDGLSRRLQASLHLTLHRFREALDLGKRLQTEFPTDQFVYGVLTDANAELGNYPEAVAAAQKMVDLKPNSISYARVAHLRSLHGDHAGAVEMYKLAARTTDPQDKEAQSWTLSQLGSEYWKNGKYIDAEKAYDEALQVFPDYHFAVAGKGRVRAAQGDFAAAEKLLVSSASRVPTPDTMILLGDVYTAQGNTEKARSQYELVQTGEQAMGELHDEHRLALFWADHNINLDRALDVAARDYEEVKDIYASDTLAWCLYKKDRFAEAKTMVAEAMRLNTNDAKILYHAGMIEKALNNKKQAAKLLRSALAINPSFDLIQAPEAKKALDEIS